MKGFLRLALFTLGVSLVYTAVGQVLPQLESWPPPEVRAGSDIGPDALAQAGAAVFAANCVQCHGSGNSGRGPDLASVGARAVVRAEQRSRDTGETYEAVDYLVESLCRPAAYLVEGYAATMPPQGRLLTGGQLLAAVAFLQSQGSEPTVRGKDVAPLDRFACRRSKVSGKASVGRPDAVFEAFGCAACHALESTERRVGPGLAGVGQRLDRGLLYEAILDPDASIPAADPPYPEGLMKKTLDANGFYDRMTRTDYAALVRWLSEK